jgi:hypothetical protein
MRYVLLLASLLLFNSPSFHALSQKHEDAHQNYDVQAHEENLLHATLGGRRTGAERLNETAFQKVKEQHQKQAAVAAEEEKERSYHFIIRHDNKVTRASARRYHWRR